MDPRDLDQEVRQELRSLARDTAELTAKHLVMTGRLLDEDPETALAHARAAGALAGRIGPVREAVGLAAYAAQEWAEALSELRAARRITGRADHLAVMADCERALGRPERALTMLDDPDVPKLDQSTRVELVIVVAGARRDLGQADAGVLLLQGPARATTAKRPWATRLWYAFADALLTAGREEEAREWFSKAAEQDGQGETDALDRLLELDGVVLEDLQSSGDDADDSEEAETEQVDLEALLRAPVAGADPVPEDAPADAPAAELVSGSTVEEDQPAPEDISAQEGSTGPDVTDAAPAAAAEPAGPLFTDEERVTPAERASVRAPAVAFAPPPEQSEDVDDDAPEARQD